MHTFKRAMVMAGLVSLVALPVGAQSGTPPSPRSKQPEPPMGAAQVARDSGKLASSDSKFMHEAAIGGMTEVALGRLAADKASSADVKQFGQRMIDDHSKANDELKALAAQKGEVLPTELDASHKALQDRLSKLSGDAFDKAYMKEMVRDHTEDVAEFRKMSTSASDDDLKAWVGKTLPTLEEHLKMAKSTATKVGSSE
jgi:putative membrane protein